MAIDPRGFNDGEIREIDEAFLKQANVSWLTRTWLAIALPWGLGRLAKELGGPGLERSKRTHELFAKTNRVDIVPSQSDLRGFQLVIDGMLSLFFVQDGDHFVYDGFEMGPCEEGDVTLFDKIRQ
jgi:hypothetical protein